MFYVFVIIIILFDKYIETNEEFSKERRKIAVLPTY